MGYEIKTLGEGQVNSTKAALYTVPAGTKTIVKGVFLVNTSTGAELVNMYVCTSTGTSRRIIPKDLSLASGYSLTLDSNITLGSTGSKIEAATSTTNCVDYLVNGVEYSTS